MIFRCIDVETLGLEADDGVCEIGWCDVAQVDGRFVVDARPKAALVNPGRPIPPTASAVHHIVDADVVGALSFDDCLRDVIGDEAAMRGDVILCAHNAAFEQKFIKTDLKWICTYKISVSKAPNAPAHNLQTMRYWSNLVLDIAAASPPHRAGPDAYVGAHLLARLLAKYPWDELVEISARPVLLPRLRFGKHQGIPCCDVPQDYWQWVLANIKDDEDVQHTARHYLGEGVNNGSH